MYVARLSSITFLVTCTKDDPEPVKKDDISRMMGSVMSVLLRRNDLAGHVNFN